MNSLFIFSNTFFMLDAPLGLGLYFQNPGTNLAEELILFHDHVSFYLITTAIGIFWWLFWITNSKNSISNKHLQHGSLLEIIWTIIPAIILILIAIPSFKLLYLLDEIIDPAITIKAIGLQWYWAYEYSDFVNLADNVSVSFDSYCLDDADLQPGQLRLLEVDNKLILPVDTHIRVITTSNDVMHCFAVPGLAVRTDAIPGRLNSLSFLINRLGIYRGICAELCGTAHYQMPIVVQGVTTSEFSNWILNELDQL